MRRTKSTDAWDGNTLLKRYELRWKIKWRLVYLGALRIMGEIPITHLKAPAAILSAIKTAYLLSDSCHPCSIQAIDCFLVSKTSESQSNYSSWWLDFFFLVLISSNLINRIPRCKQKQGSVWDGLLFEFQTLFAFTSSAYGVVCLSVTSVRVAWTPRWRAMKTHGLVLTTINLEYCSSQNSRPSQYLQTNGRLQKFSNFWILNYLGSKQISGIETGWRL